MGVYIKGKFGLLQDCDAFKEMRHASHLNEIRVYANRDRCGDDLRVQYQISNANVAFDRGERKS